ncbi:MAG: hypothetical protein GY901_12445, partial [Actinomycetia bacterium]|nr:hypothetical protein [Actinomycetes bacterium]
ALDGGLDAVLEGFFAADHDAADHEAVADRAEVESPPVAVDPDEADIDEADIDSFDHYELFFACLDPEPVGEPVDDGS